MAQSLWALFTSTLAISLVFVVIPFCRDVKVLASVMALAGLAMGCIDTVANMQLVRMYQKDSAVFLQLPVPMAVLFLLSKERLLTCFSQRKPLLLPADELALETRPPEKEDTSSLPPKFQPHSGHEDLFSCCQRKNCRGAPYSFFAIHVTAALVLFMTDGMTGAYSAFVYSYAVEKPLSVGHKVAGYLPSLFWGFITLGRLISIPISSRMRPVTMVFTNVVSGVVVTFLVLLIFSSNVIFLFVGTASLGLFLSSTFPSMLAYTEDILQYKGCATTVLVTGAGIGEMVLQMLVGLIFQAQGSYSFLVCGVIFGCLAFTFYVLLLFFHRMHPELSSGEEKIRFYTRGGKQ
uniref:Major facilitator superfamily domain-containing protein 4A n=1 Tax=Ictidomys tridecemlineatus TaxID=43179 RepID=I3MNK5_ICTTR